MFLNNYGEPLNGHISKFKCFPNPLYITKSRNTNDFLLHVCYKEQACQLLKFPKLQEVKKVDYWELSKHFFNGISRNQCGFIYLLPKIVSWAKFEGKLFSDAKFLGPLLQRLPLNVYHEQGSAQLVHVVIDYCYTSGLVVK